MRRELQRIFWAGIALTVLLALLVIGMMTGIRIGDIREHLTAILHTASAWTEESTDNLPSLAQRVAHEAAPLRVTFITDRGLVVADSEHSGLEMENHMNRPELQEALSGGIGQDVRMSETEKVITMYAAMCITPKLILRLSYPLHEILSFVLFVSAGILLLLLLLYLIQQRMLRHFTGRVVAQMDGVLALLDGEEERPVLFAEFGPPMKRIGYQVERMQRDMEEIQRTMQMRQRFIANASHELKSPLTSIRGFAEMLHEGMADSAEEQEMFTDCILNECVRMQDVIEDVLMLSRAELGDDTQPRTVVHAANLAGEIATALSPRTAQKGIQIDIQGDTTLEAVEKDVWEILYNLMDNAVRYGREGGHVRVRLSREAIQVEDDGVGVAAEHLPLLFEAFYRVDGGNERGGGTGLGLSIVRRLAEKYGARVEVNSEPGRGTCFTVHLTGPEDNDTGEL